MDAEREPCRYGKATQTRPISEALNKTFVDNQADRAHSKDLVDGERGYRTQEPTDVGQHTEIHEPKLIRYLLIEPHDIESLDRVYDNARQCCKCSTVRIETKSIQRCYRCSHLMCERCTGRLGQWVLKVELDEQGKIGVLSDFCG